MDKVSFTIICDNCGSKNIYICGDTTFKAQIECEDCGALGAEDDNLLINGK